jgi:hypothetical protein
MNYAGGALTVVNSTVAGNSASAGNGAEIFNAAPSNSFGPNALTLKNSILANSALGGNCYLSGGTYTSAGHNLSDDSSCSAFLTATADLNSTPAGLDPNGLQNNGGPTPTVAESATSPSIDFVPLKDCTDQNGHPLRFDQAHAPVGPMRRELTRGGQACEAGAQYHRPHGVGRGDGIGAQGYASLQKLSPENKTQVEVGAENAGENTDPQADQKATPRLIGWVCWVRLFLLPALAGGARVR